jgi:thiol-disulfide isomerase/thioredoxin
MCPMWVWFFVICIAVYVMNNPKTDYCDLPLWVWVVIGAIFAHFFNNMIYNNEDTKEDFKNEKKIIVYNFNTSWCGWSKRFQPEWDDFSNTATSLNITAIDVKCDDKIPDDTPNDKKVELTKQYEDNRKLAEKFNVPGYPYIVILVDDVPKPYEGERTSKALQEYIKLVL